MHTFTGKWITDSEFSNLEPRNIFHRQFDRVNLPCDEHRNCHILFRKKFSISEKPENATIFITADDYYKLYINGKFVCQGPTPSYHFEYNYNVVDVSEFLVDGENTIAVHTLYQGLINRVWQSGDNRHGLLLDLCAGEEVLVSSDSSFKTHRHTAYTEIGVTPAQKWFQTQFLELYDSRAEEIGFEEIGFDDSEWGNARINEHSDHTLKEQQTKMLVFERILPISKKVEQGRVIYDFGSIYVGYFSAVAKGKNGAKVIVRCGQELNDDGSVRYTLRANAVYEEEWILNDGESIIDWYDYKTFRYVELDFEDEVLFADEYLNARHYPFELNCEIKPEFNNNKNLTDIWNLCSNSLKYGVQEVIQDCMEREKGFYMGDGIYSELTRMILTKDDSIARKLIDSAFKAFSVEGGLHTCLCSSHMQEIAEFPLFLAPFVLWHYKLIGDKEYLNQNFKPCVQVLEFYRENYEKNFLLNSLDKWCVVEWPPSYRDGYDADLTDFHIYDEPHVALNAYYIRAVRSVNKIAEILGEDSYRDASKLTDAFFNAFYDREKHLFKDREDTDHIGLIGNCFSFGLGIIPDSKFEENFLKMLEERGFSTLSFYTAFIVLSQLCVKEKHDVLQKCLEDDGAWMRMLREGATTTFEGWGKECKSNASLFHLTLSYAAVFLADIDQKSLFEI